MSDSESESVIDDVVSLFATCIKDPTRPTRCARVLCGCLHLLDGRGDIESYAYDARYCDPRNDEYEDIRKTYPEHLNACVALLSLPRTAQDKKDLNASLSEYTCSGPTSDEKGWLLEWLHHFQPDRTFNFEVFIRALVRHLAGVLLDAVNSKTVGCIATQPGLRKNRRKHTGSSMAHGRWPAPSPRPRAVRTGLCCLLPHM